MYTLHMSMAEALMHGLNAYLVTTQHAILGVLSNPVHMRVGNERQYV